MDQTLPPPDDRYDRLLADAQALIGWLIGEIAARLAAGGGLKALRWTLRHLITPAEALMRRAPERAPTGCRSTSARASRLPASRLRRLPSVHRWMKQPSPLGSPAVSQRWRRPSPIPSGLRAACSANG